MSELASLLLETGQAHHQAFIETDGADPEWPLWYAEYLHPRIGEHLRREPTRSRIIYLIQAAEKAHIEADDGSPWSESYAEFLTNND